MKLRIWGLLATAAFAAPCIHSKREAAMKTWSIVAVTAVAFLGLANFASAQGGFQVSSMTFKNNKYLPLSAIDYQAFTTPIMTRGNECTPNFRTPLPW